MIFRLVLDNTRAKVDELADDADSDDSLLCVLFG